MDTKERTDVINKALDENATLQAKLAERDEEIARLREHLQIQEREIAALQAENGGRGKATNTKDSREETTAIKTNGAAHQAATDGLHDLMARARNLGW